jgi:hypothetical protein
LKKDIYKLILFCASKTPGLRRLVSERNKYLKELNKYLTWKVPGHYYSPIPSSDDIQVSIREYKNNKKSILVDIDLNIEEQLSLLDDLKKYYEEMPYEQGSIKAQHKYFDNTNYTYIDAIFLYSMIRHLKPERIIEIGSGFSSRFILDTNKIFFNNTISCTFIDPYPQVLESLIEKSDPIIDIQKRKIQEIKSDYFSSLNQNDILLIDSSHVSKAGSDLNYIMFNILPSVQAGVYIHFHDIFYPFEYPSEWLSVGVAWNEVYIMRAFLQHNKNYKIKLFASYLKENHFDKIKLIFPLAAFDHDPDKSMKTSPASSLWLKKYS